MQDMYAANDFFEYWSWWLSCLYAYRLGWLIPYWFYNELVNLTLILVSATWEMMSHVCNAYSKVSLDHGPLNTANDQIATSQRRLQDENYVEGWRAFFEIDRIGFPGKLVMGQNWMGYFSSYGRFATFRIFIFCVLRSHLVSCQFWSKTRQCRQNSLGHERCYIDLGCMDSRTCHDCHSNYDYVFAGSTWLSEVYIFRSLSQIRHFFILLIIRKRLRWTRRTASFRTLGFVQWSEIV